MASLLDRESSFCQKDLRDQILRALYSQKQNSTFCDVIMKVGGSDIYVHSIVLAAASPYFCAFLTQDLPRHFSQRSPQIIEIQIDGSDKSTMYKDAVETVIDFLYSGTLHVTTQTVSQISELARIMQLDVVVKYCEDFILHRKDPSLLTAPPRKTADVGVCTEADNLTEGVSLISKKITSGYTVLSPTRPLVSQLPQKVFKPGRLVSTSTQVTPVLLGILPPPPKQTRDTKTQTLGKDFPEKVKGQHSGRIGRKKSVNPVEGTEIVVEITRNSEKATSVRLLNNSEDDFKTQEEIAEPQETINEGDATALSDPNRGNFMVLESENNVGVIVDTGSGDLSDEHNLRRRSGRRPKPTPKILALKRIATSPPKGGPPFKIGQVGQVLADVDEGQELNKEVLTDENTRKSPRKSKLIPREEIIILAEEYIPVSPSEKPSEDQKLGAGTGDEQIKELILYTDGIPDVEPEHPRPVRKPKRSGPRKTRKGHFKFTCSECDFRTNKVREFTSHKRLHKMENNICYYCEEKFENKDDLTEHFQKHKGPLPFFCPVCDCRFKSRTQLNIHLPKHSDDKPFVCEVCSAGFKWKHALKSHMIVHSNRKDHLCDECGYATAHKCQLKAHKLIHTGQTYRCPFTDCRFQATKRQNLKYHLLTHTREKPHQCEICGQSFSLIKNMRRHMLLHSTDKPHHCNECDFSTTRFDKLKEHMLKLHGMGSPPEKRVRVADLVQQNFIDNATGESFEDKSVGLELSEGGVISDNAAEAIAGGAIAVTAEELVQATGGAEEVTVLSDAQAVQFIPGQTIIITQTGEDGEVQTHEVTLAPQPGLLEGTTNDQVQNGLQYTEVMIPSGQLNDYVQELTYVGQT